MTKRILRKHFLIFTFLLIVLVGVELALYRYFSRLEKSSNEVMDFSQQLVSYEENKKIYDEESKSISSIQAEVKDIASNLITPANMPSFLSSLENLAKANNVEFVITTVQTPNVGTTSQKFLIDFSAKGSEKNLDSFLKNLTYQTYQVKFNKLSFASTSSTPDETSGKAKPLSSWEVLASIQVMSF